MTKNKISKYKLHQKPETNYRLKRDERGEVGIWNVIQGRWELERRWGSITLAERYLEKTLPNKNWARHGFILINKDKDKEIVWARLHY